MKEKKSKGERRGRKRRRGKRAEVKRGRLYQELLD